MVYNEKTKRRVVPRWRSSIIAASSKDFRPIRESQSVLRVRQETTLSLQLEEFAKAPNLGPAAELLSTAIRLRDVDAGVLAANFIRDKAGLAPTMLLRAANAVHIAADPYPSAAIPDDGDAIARIRRILTLRPRSANLWVDLARHQAGLGKTHKALQSMRIGLALAPNHRWVLRSASRLLLHADEAEAAHKLLAYHPRTAGDRWLMAAEIASAQIANRPPKFASKARDLLRPHRLSASHLSELAASVATLELESGANKSARRLLRLALEDPTENALAQVEWAERNV